MEERGSHYLLPLPHICHIYHIWDMWRKICHVEKFQIYMHDRCGEIWNFSTFGVISNFSTWQMWRNLTFLHMLSNFKFFHMTDVEKSEVSPHLASVWCEECLNICERYALLLKNWFYAVLSRNLFCRDSRTFVWRKIEPKIGYVEKKWQISGMPPPPLIPSRKVGE